MAKIYGQLEKAQVENVGALPTAGVKGKIVFLTTDSQFYYDNGSAFVALVDKTTTQTLTGKTLSGNIATNLISGAATVTLPTTTGTLATLANAETLTNKTLTAPIIDAISATEIATPSNPSAGTIKVYAKTDDKLYTLNSTGVETQVGSGAGGAINYISANPDAESSTTGFTTYKEASVGSLPVLATGGAADAAFTFTRTTTTPLRGVGSFKLSTTNTNLQGNAVSYAFTVPAADAAKVISISFDYNITAVSGTAYATGDMIVYIFDGTNLIQPAGYQIQAVGSTIANKHIATFQTSSTATSYKLIFHRAVATTSGFDMRIDNIQVGPQVVQYGAPITDWVPYSAAPVITSWSSGVGTVTGKWRRVGDSMECDVNIPLTGNPTGSLTDVALPVGYTIDTTKLSASAASNEYYGVGKTVAAGTGYPLWVAYKSTTTMRPLIANSAGTNLVDAGISATVPNTYANTDSVQMTFRVPITGWSSTVQMSNDTDTRVVSANYVGQPTGTLNGSFNIATFPTKVKDTHGAYSSGSYTVAVAGDYDISAQIDVSAASAAVGNYVQCAIYIDGVKKYFGITYVGSTSLTEILAAVSVKAYPLTAGQVVTIQSRTTMTTPAYVNDATSNYFSIARVSGPSAIAASESVAMRATTTNAQSISDTATAVITTWTTTYDTHGQFNATTGVYTVGTPGKYRISAGASSTSAARTVASGKYAALKVSGTKSIQLYAAVVWASITTYLTMSGSTSESFITGDTISISISNQSGSTYVLDGSAGDNWVCIERIGN